MFKAKLFIFEREYEVLKFEIRYSQKIDAIGMPIERVNGNFISVEFPSIRNEREFFEVAFSNRKTVKGYVRFYRRDGFQKFYDYEFANTYIVNFDETFDAVNKKPLTTKVQFNAGIVKRDDVEFATNWNPSNPFKKQAALTALSVIDEEEPEKEEEKEPEKDNIIHIYHTGHISKVDFQNHKTVAYIYHDKNDCEHHLGVCSLTNIRLWEKKNIISKLEGVLVRMEDLMSFKNDDIVFKYEFSSTTRRYINPENFATLLGAMIKVGYTDFTSTGFSNRDGNPGISNSHINGVAGDFLYLNKKLSNKTTLLGDDEFDYKRMSTFVKALNSFGWGKDKPMLSEYFTFNGKENELINYTTHYKKQLKNGKWVRHHHHLHINGLIPNYYEKN